MPIEIPMDVIVKEFIFLALLLALAITVLQAEKMERVARAATVQTMVLILILEFADTADYFLALLPYPSSWRILTSVIGYSGRPLIAWAVLCTLLGKKRNRRYLFLIPAVINALIYCTAFWTDIAFCFNENNIWVGGPLSRMVVVTVIFYVTFIIVLMVKGSRKFKQTHVIAFFAVFCVITASVLEIVGDHPNVLYSTVLIILLMYYMYMYSIRMKSAIDASELELREQKVSLSMSQMKPHFIGNSMATIRRLIKKNPEKAVEAMDYFIDYLRITIDNSDETNMVYVSEELKFVKDYLYIEKLRFGDALRYEITEEFDDFLIPPFSIQPIVENAIRHGIRKREDGVGTLKISIQTSEKEHLILVEDDGVGYDVDAVSQNDDGHTHVGTKNVRFRLENMCKGYLEIESEPGVGTRASIHVPLT